MITQLEERNVMSNCQMLVATSPVTVQLSVVGVGDDGRVPGLAANDWLDGLDASLVGYGPHAVDGEVSHNWAFVHVPGETALMCCGCVENVEFKVTV